MFTYIVHISFIYMFYMLEYSFVQQQRDRYRLLLNCFVTHICVKTEYETIHAQYTHSTVK